MSSAPSDNFNICPMGFQLQLWITSYCSLPQETSLHIPLEGKPQTADRIKASWHLGELVGQSKRSSLTVVPHGQLLLTVEVMGLGWWNNWEANLSKFNSPTLFPDLSLFFPPKRGGNCLTHGFSVIPSWKSGTWNSHAVLPNVCCSLV